MTSAITIVMKRTAITEEDASYYVELAEARVRLYLNLDANTDVEKYVFAISDIATLLYQIDASTKQTANSIGFKSESFSEGGVSVSKSGLTGAEVREQYEAAIQDVLSNLDGNIGKVRFL